MIKIQNLDKITDIFFCHIEIPHIPKIDQLNHELFTKIFKKEAHGINCNIKSYGHTYGYSLEINIVELDEFIYFPKNNIQNFSTIIKGNIEYYVKPLPSIADRIQSAIFTAIKQHKWSIKALCNKEVQCVRLIKSIYISDNNTYLSYDQKMSKLPGFLQNNIYIQNLVYALENINLFVFDFENIYNLPIHLISACLYKENLGILYQNKIYYLSATNTVNENTIIFSINCRLFDIYILYKKDITRTDYIECRNKIFLNHKLGTILDKITRMKEIALLLNIKDINIDSYELEITSEVYMDLLVSPFTEYIDDRLNIISIIDDLRCLEAPEATSDPYGLKKSTDTLIQYYINNKFDINILSNNKIYFLSRFELYNQQQNILTKYLRITTEEKYQYYNLEINKSYLLRVYNLYLSWQNDTLDTVSIFENFSLLNIDNILNKYNDLINKYNISTHNQYKNEITSFINTLDMIFNISAFLSNQ